MHRQTAVLILASLVAIAADNHTAEVDKLFAAWDKPGSPGAAVAVVRNGEIVYKRGYGFANLEYDIPITPSTVFHVASVSKQFTAMAILLLEKQGKPSIEDDVRMYLPELADFGARITLHHLLNHTSGLRDQWDLLNMAGWRMDDVITQRQILNMVFHQKELNFTPGSEHLYCNTGFTLLAEIVRRVSGRTLREFAHDEIFLPLGMTSTHFHDDHEMIVKNRAYSYRPAADTPFKLAALNYANMGATSLFTTVEDLAKWAHNFEEPGVGDRALIERMETPGVLNNGKKLNYACGLGIGELRGLRRVEHSGGDAGYRSEIMMFPDEKFSVVVLANMATLPAFPLAQKVAAIYLQNRFLKPEQPEHRPEQQAPKHEPIEPDKLREFTGDYWSDELGTTYTVVVRGGALVATHRRLDDIVLVHNTGDDFRSFHFTRDSAGRVTGLMLSSGRVRNLRLVKQPATAK
jgi:CubicO group peptidase (beta-lactamase class C family)